MNKKYLYNVIIDEGNPQYSVIEIVTDYELELIVDPLRKEVPVLWIGSQTKITFMAESAELIGFGEAPE